MVSNSRKSLFKIHEIKPSHSSENAKATFKINRALGKHKNDPHREEKMAAANNKKQRREEEEEEGIHTSDDEEDKNIQHHNYVDIDDEDDQEGIKDHLVELNKQKEDISQKSHTTKGKTKKCDPVFLMHH